MQMHHMVGVGTSMYVVKFVMYVGWLEESHEMGSLGLKRPDLD